MNNFIFPGKFCSRGFLYTYDCYIYLDKYNGKIMIMRNYHNGLKLKGYLIDLSNITGISYDLNINIDMKIILETNCNNIYFEYNLIDNSFLTSNTSKCYYYLIGTHKDIIKLLKDPKYGIITNDYFRNIANDGLPYWCVWIDFFDHKFRLLIQYIMVYIEFCMFIWSIYQIFKTFPDLITLISTTMITLQESYKNNYIMKYFLYFIDIPISLLIYSIKAIYEILIYPFQIVGNYIRVLVQLKIISLLDLNLFKNIFQNFTKIIKNSYKFIQNSKVILISNKIHNIKKKIPSQISKENISYVSNIKEKTIFIWNFCLKPIKYVYDVIKAPLIGEFGRTVRSKFNNTVPKK